MVKEYIGNQLLISHLVVSRATALYEAAQVLYLLVCLFSFVSSLSVFLVGIEKVIAGGALRGDVVHAETLAFHFCLSAS